ncbi:hypothetical protein [Micromonospora rosaria]|uniref:hypothetical protein n=1 Tax=Micromonospora rosaria TaxID=47874 RepID=UPI000AB9A378|nr:hypothetical protein [Micromonospora rosaria]
MRAMLLVIGIVAVALVLLGLLLEAARWLIIVGAVAFVVLLVLAFVRGRRTARR